MRAGLGFVDRALELRRRLGPQVGVDLLVYTPEERRELARHRRFVGGKRSSGEGGVPASGTGRPEAVCLRGGRPAGSPPGREKGVFAQVRFQARESTERCLKALLTRKGLVPRTHEIGDPWRELLQAARDLLAPLEGEVLELDGNDTVTSCPEAVAGTRTEGLPRQSHAEAALRGAERWWQLTSDLVSRQPGNARRRARARGLFPEECKQDGKIAPGWPTQKTDTQRTRPAPTPEILTSSFATSCHNLRSNFSSTKDSTSALFWSLAALISATSASAPSSPSLSRRALGTVTSGMSSTRFPIWPNSTGLDPG